MYLKLILIFCFLYNIQCALASDTYLYNKRIIGGNTTDFNNSIDPTPGEWSWVVALIDQNNEHFCGASLIASQWLLTAAHCLYNDSAQFNHNLKITAVFQQSDLSEINQNTLTREIIQTIPHPDYDYFKDNNDIALLKLDEPITDIKPVSIPGDYFNVPIVPEYTTATILGWGSINNFNTNTQLYKAQVPIADFQECLSNYKDFGININRNMICAGYKIGGVDSCRGDSGGPLVIPHESGNGWKQFGIVSFGVGCALPNLFGVYTRTSRYNNFIQSHICQNKVPGPLLNVEQNDTTKKITLTLSNSSIDSKGFRVYFAPFPNAESILHYDLLNTDSITGSLNKRYYMVAQSLQNNCSSEFSNLLVTPSFQFD